METTLARGLKDVVLDTTESSFIDGEAGVLLYRGYTIHDLAQQSNFEEVCYLLLHGVLPTGSRTRCLLEASDLAACTPTPGYRGHPAR